MLRDRMVTLDLDHPDKETEISITEAKSGLDRQSAKKIVNIVRGLRDSGKCEFAPTIRGCIMIAKTLTTSGGAVLADDKLFRNICTDVLASETSRVGCGSSAKRIRKVIDELIDTHCNNGEKPREGREKKLRPSVKTAEPGWTSPELRANMSLTVKIISAFITQGICNFKTHKGNGR